LISSYGLHAAERECVLDRKVHLEKDLIRNIPDIPPLCDSLPGLTRQRIDLGDVILYGEQEGDGPALVLLHGGPGATHHEFHPAMSRFKDFVRIIYYDQRGCGQSEFKPGKGYSVDQAVDDLHRLLQALKLSRWFVLGHSYGGALAQCYTVKHPEDVAGLILVGSAEAAPLMLNRSRQYDFISPEERKKIFQAHTTSGLTVSQQIYNAFLNGDWKRQLFYKPSADDFARIARYEWVQDRHFNSLMSGDVRRYDLRGAFDACPIPTLIVEGVWDLTWNTDKPEKLHKVLPRAKLAMIDQAGHSPFADQPEQFGRLLKEFLNGPRASDADLARWKGQLATWKAEKERSPGFLLRTAKGGRKSSQRIADAYRPQWLGALSDPWQLLRVGMALYDVKRYRDALAAFEKMGQIAGEDKLAQPVALIWQAQMLDLLGRRQEAIALYGKVRDMNVRGGMSHDQFGLRYSPSDYAGQRMKEPFTRLENREEE